MTTTASRAPAVQRVRRNRITDRDAAVVAVVAAFGAVGGAVAGAHPTAWRPADVLLTACFAGFVTWAGASCPWWALAVSAGVATVAASSPWWAAASVVAFVIAVVVGARRLSVPVGRALSAGLAINALLRCEDSWRFGTSAVVAGVIAVVVVATGLSRRGRLARRTVRRLAVVVGLVAGAAALGAVIAVVQANGDLRDGERALHRAASALQRGDIPVAVEQLEASDALLGRASRTLARPWARPALALPVLGQHLDALVGLDRAAVDLASQATTSVAQVDVESLRVVHGVIDLDALAILERPFGDTNAALRRMSRAIADARSPWLVAPLGDRVDTLGQEVDRLVEQTDRAVAAVRLAPSMLGRDGPRTYFVAFTTPAEARGLGGYMGTWAELRADDGRLEVARTGQTGELTGEMRAALPVLDGPPDYLARYGRFGAGVDGQPVAVDFWSNVTMSPDFPSITDVIAQLYPASGGSHIDGAIALDVESISRFLDVTGPLQVDTPDGPVQLTAANAVQYLLRDQYVEVADDATRDAVLESITTELVDSVFGGDLPGPRVLAATLGPAIAEGRMVVWSRHPQDQTLLRQLNMSGELPAPDGDGLAVVSTNAGANKIDAYLRRSISYDAQVDEVTGRIRAAVTIRLANDAPPGLPPVVLGNPFGLPTGTNRQYVSVYSPWDLTAAELDGTAAGMEPGSEQGWHVYSRYVDIPAGGEVEIRLGLSGELRGGEGYRLLLRSQPLTYPDVVRIDVRTTSGRPLLQSHQVRVGVEQLVASR